MPKPSVGYEETITLIKEGKSNTEIAKQLGLSPGTVRSRRSRYNASVATVAMQSDKTPAITAIQTKKKSAPSVATVAPGSKDADELPVRRRLTVLDGGQPNAHPVELPTITQVKQVIWSCIIELQGQPLLQMKAFGVYLRALKVEQSLPGSDDQPKELRMTAEETAEKIVRLLGLPQ